MAKGRETLSTASVTNPGKYYNGPEEAQMEFLLVCQQELMHEAHDGFVSASAFARFVFEYCEESPQTGPNCIKHNVFSALPVEIQLAFVDRLCPSDQAEKLECLNRLNEEKEEALVSEWELFGVCFQTFNQLVPAGLLAADLNDSDPDEEVDYSGSNHPDAQTMAENRSKLKRKKEKSKRAMKTSAPTISSSPSSSIMPASSPTTRPLLRPSHSTIPSVSPSPTTLLPETPIDPIPQQPSSSPATPTDPPGISPTSPLLPAQPTSRTLSPLPTQLPKRTESPGLILPIPPEQSLEGQSQNSLGTAGVAGIAAAALFLPLFLAFALMRYRSNRARYAVVRDINLGESHSILSEDSDFLGGCYAMSPPSRRSVDSQFNPPIEEISSRHMHSIDNPVAPATFLVSGTMPPPLDIRPVSLGSGDMPDILPSDNREVPLGLGTIPPHDDRVSGGIQPDQIALPDAASTDALLPLRTSGPGGLSFD